MSKQYSLETLALHEGQDRKQARFSSGIPFI